MLLSELMYEKSVYYNLQVVIEVLGFPGGSAGKESACNAGDLGSIPGLGSSPGEGNSYPLQYSGLENSMNCIVHGVTESDMTECKCCAVCIDMLVLINLKTGRLIQWDVLN